MAHSLAAAGFELSQGGFDDNARLSGRFSGVDFNQDGLLTLTLPDNGSAYGAINELNEFEVTFSGNSLVAPFTVGIPELLSAQFGIPCCRRAAGYGFFFDLISGNGLQFVAMSPHHIMMVIDENDVTDAFAGVGEGCTFVHGSGGCQSSSGAAYNPIVTPNPVTGGGWMMLCAFFALRIAGRFPDHFGKARSPRCGIN